MKPGNPLSILLPLALGGCAFPGAPRLAGAADGARLSESGAAVPVGQGFDAYTCYHDDVPVYLEFVVFAPNAFVVFPNFGKDYNYQDNKFLEITDGDDLNTLEDLPTSNIKIVESMWLEGETNGFPARATLCQGTRVFSLSGSLNSTIVMHECGHAAGLLHPNETAPPGSCARSNPAANADVNRLMYVEDLAVNPNPQGNEVNRVEAQAFRDWYPPVIQMQ